jgi:hypothetical protein
VGSIRQAVACGSRTTAALPCLAFVTWAGKDKGACSMFVRFVHISLSDRPDPSILTASKGDTCRFPSALRQTRHRIKMASLAQPALMPVTPPQSTSTALNQPTAARSRSSWPRRTAHRGNTAPVPPSDPAQDDPFDNPTSTEPNQLRGRVATEPILRNGKDALHPVKIDAYRLPWDKLRPYLEKQFQRKLPLTLVSAPRKKISGLLPGPCQSKPPAHIVADGPRQLHCLASPRAQHSGMGRYR